MTTNTDTRVLSPGDVFSMGDLLNAITRKAHVRWMDDEGTIREGELRSLVVGQNNFAFAPFGTDVRDMWVWVTANGMETTFSVAHACKMIPEGGMVFE
jgi:hypothetical protein